MFGEKDPFKNPKDPELTSRLLKALETNGEIVLDYFSGSGTTGHAVLELKRSGENRKYIGIEMAECFNDVLLPRLRKAVYSKDWKLGKATTSQTGISYAFKMLKIESYEDTLNNLQLFRNESQQSLLDALPESVKDDYLLRYLLKIESRGSLLSIEQFNNPFGCKLKVAVNSAGAYEERAIDLVETFNYLVGLRVEHLDVKQNQGLAKITGWLPTGEYTLLLWRDIKLIGYEDLNELFSILNINPENNKFDVIYINGDHNIHSSHSTNVDGGEITRSLKIRQIEPEFLNKMFSDEVVR